MTKKNYEVIANVLGRQLSEVRRGIYGDIQSHENVFWDTVNQLCEAFSNDNSRFSNSRFYNWIEKMAVKLNNDY